MFETYNTVRHEVMAITSMQAVRLCKAPPDQSHETQNGSTTQGSAGQNLTMIQAEKMLTTLVDEGWFEKSKQGFYSLSPRALMELRGWLIETYNDDDGEDDEEGAQKIKQCDACKEIITVVCTHLTLPARNVSLIRNQGQRCPKLTCACRLHDICIQNFFRAQKSTRCPRCQQDWTNNHSFVGERVVTTTEKYLQGKRRSNGSATSARKNSRVVPEEVEEVADEEVEEED